MLIDLNIGTSCLIGMTFHLVWLDKASRLTPRYEGTRDVLLKQEAMLDKYKKGGKHLLLVFTSY